MFVDAPEVARITEQRVTLTIDAAEAQNLPEQPAGSRSRPPAGSAGSAASTGSSAPSLTSVSASSAAGSESRTTPTPA